MKQTDRGLALFRIQLHALHDLFSKSDFGLGNLPINFGKMAKHREGRGEKGGLRQSQIILLTDSGLVA